MSTSCSRAGPYQFVYHLIVVQFREMHVGYNSERRLMGILKHQISQLEAKR